MLLNLEHSMIRIQAVYLETMRADRNRHQRKFTQVDQFMIKKLRKIGIGTNTAI